VSNLSCETEPVVALRQKNAHVAPSQKLPQNQCRNTCAYKTSETQVAGVLASLAELELELGRERRAAAREARRARGQAVGRPKALDAAKTAVADRMHTLPLLHVAGARSYR
jgi:DNA invertase Pin-like site-specific DNA recombinase